MTFTAETWAHTAELFTAIIQHPFLQGLKDGTLPQETFNEYLRQDALYLVDYGRILAALASRAHDVDEIVFWAGGAHEAIVVERQLHSAHVNVLDNAIANPTCRAYTSYLWSLMQSESYAVAAAGMLPCFWIYSEVGAVLLKESGDLANHPYGDWISLYGDPEFDVQVDKAKAIVDRLASQAGTDELARMHQAYAQASRYEWMFWDAAWRHEQWPI